MKKKLRGSLALLLTTIIWGSAFIAQSVSMDHIGPFTFQAARSFLAVIFLLLVGLIIEGSQHELSQFWKRWKNPKLWTTGFFCGLALFTASILQQIGIQYTDAGKAGFITAMYIVLVPVCGLFVHKKPPVSALFSIILAVIGLYLLSCAGVSEINKGDLFILGGALMFAVQITLVDELARDLDGVRLNAVQTLVSGVISAFFMFTVEEPRMDTLLPCWFPIFYAGVFSSGIAYSLQIVGQKDLDPTAASLIMSLESVFAVIFGWLILHETLTPTELGGCILVFSAVVLSQIPQDFLHRIGRSRQR